MDWCLKHSSFPLLRHHRSNCFWAVVDFFSFFSTTKAATAWTIFVFVTQKVSHIHFPYNHLAIFASPFVDSVSQRESMKVRNKGESNESEYGTAEFIFKLYIVKKIPDTSCERIDLDNNRLNRSRSRWENRSWARVVQRRFQLEQRDRLWRWWTELLVKIWKRVLWQGFWS